MATRASGRKWREKPLTKTGMNYPTASACSWASASPDPVSSVNASQPVKLADTMTAPPNIAADGCGRVAMMHGRGVVSSLIRWQTFGKWSHCALVYPSSDRTTLAGARWIIEAWPGKGVQRKYVTDWEGIELFRVNGMTLEQWQVALLWAENQLGKGYDYWSVIRFLPRIHLPDNERLFCAEFVFDAFAAAGVKLQERISGQELSPREIGISPLLIKES